MMKILFMMIFMIPLSFLKNFWFNYYMYMLMFIFYYMNFCFSFFYYNISFNFGCDLLSYLMTLLSFWICGLMLMASFLIYKNNNFYNLFMLLLLLLMIFLFCTFNFLNLFMFYLFFEMSLIPMFILILGWGYQPERIQAGIYLLFYTLFASLPMMISIFYCYENFYSMMFFMLDKNIVSLFMYLFMIMVFLIKMPMFFVHLWLPKAHVEAPVSGSMILAGIMLKLGGYGLIRVMPMFLYLGMKVNYMFILISLIGGFIISLICMRQIDMKSLVAYSSVAHMGLVLSGVMTMNYWGLVGSLIMMIAHGLCSSGLFCLVNISYERLNSRSLFINKGLINLMPSLSLWWFLFNSSNMAAPPSMNLIGEIMLINSLVGWSKSSMIILSFMSFFSAVYSLYLYSYSQHGSLKMSLYSLSLGQIREFLLLLLHWLPLNIMFLSLNLFILI
uniref:NADH-ubiquinone oxidoreductase chain 4 n=1 Tax=Pselaphinae sp. 12 EF-2015 TaxID=1756871 RepID=A0A0S2M8F1_9COLE|nr:NADH deshydrogenase subunit 4 [Pselaphinae sp. 12 EF-2015]